MCSANKRNIYIFIVFLFSCCALCSCTKKNDKAEKKTQEEPQEIPVITIEDSHDDISFPPIDDYSSFSPLDNDELLSIDDHIGGELSLEPDEFEKKDYTIVWIGDSLTQGSLGEVDDNLPNAPYEKLKEITGNNVEGFGYYGYNTHDIFWFFSDEEHGNQKKDPGKVYVFWCGSNDWVVNGVGNTDASSVISQIDNFLANGGINKYIVMGTTQRLELRGDSDDYNLYDMINAQLQDHYKEHYFNVTDIISIKTGYGPDRIHLTQESYDNVAEKLAEKLREMNYL